LIKLLSYILFEKYIYILALEKASPGNQHCASCIGTLSFPIVKHTDLQLNAAWRYCSVFASLAPLYKTLDLLTYLLN